MRASTVAVTGIGLAGCSSAGGDGGNGSDGGDNGGDGGNGSDGGGAGTANQSGGQTRLDTDNPFVIGMIQPLSGPYTNLGEAHKFGGQLAIEDMNANGGIAGRKVELRTKDSEISPEKGVQAAREFQQDGVDAIYGGLLSNVALGISEFCESAQIPMVTPIYSRAAVTGQCKTYSFFISGVDSQILGGSASRGVRNTTEGTKIATVTPDYAIGHEAWEGFKQEFLNNRSGAEVVDTHFPQIGKDDYQNEIQSVISSDADIVQTLLFSQDLITFAQQAKQYNFFEETNALVSTGTGIDVIRGLGDDMVPMFVALPYYYKFPENEANQNFVQRYQEAYDEIPHNSSEQGYCNTIALKQAADAAGGASADDIVSGMEGLSVQSPGGARDIRAEDHLGVNRYIPTGWFEETPNDSYSLPWGMKEVVPVDGQNLAPAPNCG